MVFRLLPDPMTAIQNTAFYQKNGIMFEGAQNKFWYFVWLGATLTHMVSPGRGVQDPFYTPGYSNVIKWLYTFTLLSDAWLCFKFMNLCCLLSQVWVTLNYYRRVDLMPHHAWRVACDVLWNI
jgi:hypothetical protein